MNGSSLVLDTNAVIAFFDQETGLKRFLAHATWQLPSIVYGELYYGALKSARQGENIERIKRFAERCVVGNVDEGTGRTIAKIKLQLKQQGRPIPENDLWIAAIAIQHAAPLVTRDAHFSAVEGLQVLAWD